MKNKLTRDEAIFKEKLNQVSFNYEDADWNEIEESLKSQAPKTGFSSLLKGVAGLVLFSGIVVLTHQYYQSQDATNLSENTVVKIDKNEKTDVKVKEEQNTSTEDKSTPNTPVEEIEINEPIENTSSILTEDSVIPSELAIEPVNDSQNLQIDNFEKYDEVVVNQELDNTSLQKLELLVDGKPCMNQKLSISIVKSNKSEYDSYKWMVNGEKLSEKGSSLNYSIDNSGELKIEVEAYKNNILLAENTLNYSVEEYINLDFRYEDLEDPFNDLRIILKAEGEQDGTYQWDINGKRIKIGKETSYEFNNKGIYDIRLLHQSKNGCQSEIIKPVAVRKDFEPFAPNAFTPDDDGLNDIFIIESFSEEFEQFEMSIYAPNGNLVFQTNSVKEGWNGRKNNKGPLLSRATYVWKVTIQNEDNVQKSFIGRVKIMDY